MGDRLDNIEEACRSLASHANIKLLRTSGLWQTKAMYVTEQDDFLNGACEIETTLEPLELLDALQTIENKLGRKRVVQNGPRTIDLDILLYDDETVENDRLTVPHKLMLEREFVLRPLCQMIPTARLPNASTVPLTTVLQCLIASNSNATPMSTVVPVSDTVPPLQPLLGSRSTKLMAIVNMTPDSFSDGGAHTHLNERELKDVIEAHVGEGATIIDVGGQSTRPNAEMVSSHTEISRIIPMIKLIRQHTSESSGALTASPKSVAISVDTFRASVAVAAVAAGADIINDVSGGTLDPEMLPTMAALGCTVVLMHMRGDPSSMTSAENTSYPDGLVETVGRELLQRVKAAEAAGIRRWRIVLDPGIGFAKTWKQNIELLREFGRLRQYPGLEGFPWLLGVSKKSFIQKIANTTNANDTMLGTATSVAACVVGGADIIRVHNVREMREVTEVADAIWRVKSWLPEAIVGRKM